MFIYPQKDTVDITDTTQFVGTEIRIRPVLEYQGADGVWRWLTNKTIDIYHRVNTGAWEKIGSPTQGASGVYADLKYTLAVAGKHTFYAEFVGDATYAGCRKAVRAFAR